MYSSNVGFRRGYAGTVNQLIWRDTKSGKENAGDQPGEATSLNHASTPAQVWRTAKIGQPDPSGGRRASHHAQAGTPSGATGAASLNRGLIKFAMEEIAAPRHGKIVG